MNHIKLNLKYLPADILKTVQANLGPAKKGLDDLINKTCKGSEFTGWFDYPDVMGFKLLDRIQKFKQQLNVNYDSVVVIGIGGSYIGARAVQAALSSEWGNRKDTGTLPIFYAGHHVSSSATKDLLSHLDGYNPLLVVVSKSGTTTEPAVAFRILRKYLQKRFGDKGAHQRVVAVTDPKAGALRAMATQENWPTFEVPSDIGGRYSVLSAVGMLPLVLAGFDGGAIMKGAQEQFVEIKAKGMDSAAVQYAAARNACYAKGKVIECLAYGEPNLHYLIEWWKQLFGESEGKQSKGILPVGLAYTTDLHSLGQIVQEGMRNLFETFLFFEYEDAPLKIPAMPESRVDELSYLEGTSLAVLNDTAMEATRLAHYDGGVPCITLKAGPLNAATIGSLFAFFETACAVSASVLGVNAFDQPGVENYKKNLFGLLGKPGFENLGKELRMRGL